jgi:hypothetical protein
MLAATSMNGKEPQNPPSITPQILGESSAQVLDGILEKSYEFAQHLDNQTNILVSVNVAIFLFSLSSYLSYAHATPFLLLSIFSGLSCLIGLLAIHPPKMMRKRGQEESLMYNKHIASLPSAKAYAQELSSIIENKDAIIRQYAIEIYNVAKFYYRPKRRLFHLTREILIIGMAVSLISFLLELI